MEEIGARDSRKCSGRGFEEIVGVKIQENARGVDFRRRNELKLTF